MAETAESKLDLLGVQEDRWDREVLIRQDNYEIKEDELCRACSMHGGEEEYL
jgi:hypothetical protein